MKHRICSLLLILCLLSQLWIPVQAASNMTTGSEGKAFIDEHQGGKSYDLSMAEASVNGFIDKYNLSLQQHQFDALVDFVISLSNYTVLTSGNYQIERVIGSGKYTDAQLATVLTGWGVKNSDGSVSETALRRRIREAKLFLYGSYSGECEANFRYVIFNPNGGTLDNAFNTVTCFPYGTTYGDLGIPTRSGKYFAGWYTTAGSGGEHIYNNTLVDRNRTLHARWSEIPISDPNTGSGPGNFDYPELKVSESLIDFIKEQEGFSATKYWDYSQWTIGYGTEWKSDDYPTGTITEVEADYELRLEIAEFEKEVDRLLAKGTVQHNQHQYDAIISFTFNLGGQWMKPANRIYQYVLFGYPNEQEFVDAMGAWASAGGSVVTGLMQRRIDEADMYLNGNYKRFSKTYFGAHLTVDTTDKTALIDKNGKSYALFYAIAGQPVGELPSATREGYYLTGWADGNGVIYTPETIAPGKITTLKARWAEGTEPEDPEDPEKPEDPEDPEKPEDPEDPEKPEDPTEPPAPETVFEDVSSNAWYAPYVTAAVEKGLLNGLGKGRFGPDNTMTRAMVVTVLYRMAGEPESTATHPFTDVPDGKWYSTPVAWAYEAAIVNGVTADRFGLEEAVTRQQLVTLLYRFAQQVGVDTSGRDLLADFADRDSISGYAEEPFQWAVAMDIINGTNGSLLPRNTATRAQCAKIMVIFADLMS